MGKNTKIEWTDHTCNFWWGCQKITPACANCYAELLSRQWGHDIWGPDTTRYRTKSPWRDVIKWDAAAQKNQVRQMVFCQSMSDFFEDHPMLTTWREEAMSILENLECLDIQLLTKRPENIPQMASRWMADWPAHIWVGVSIGKQASVDHMLGHLANVPTRLRFISAEPLLGPLRLNLDGIGWLIIGGESGPRARPLDMDWLRDIINQAEMAGVPVHVKQLGTVWAEQNGSTGKGENIEDWPADVRVRQFPERHDKGGR